jgi:hypothetical protein
MEGLFLWLAPGAGGLAHAKLRIQLGHAAHVSQCLTVFAASGTVFQTNGRFEHIPFLAHALDAYTVIDTTDNIIDTDIRRARHSRNHYRKTLHGFKMSVSLRDFLHCLACAVYTAIA